MLKRIHPLWNDRIKRANAEMEETHGLTDHNKYMSSLNHLPFVEFLAHLYD